MGGKVEQFQVLLQAFDLIFEAKLWADKKPSEILNILMYVHTKGWLYTPMVEDKIAAVICAYRIKDGDSLTQLPAKEEGTVLYVPFVLSVDKEVDLFEVIRESMRVYLESNPDITEIILEDKNNKIKRYRLKGEEDGQEQAVGNAEHARVQDGPDIPSGISGT